MSTADVRAIARNPYLHNARLLLATAAAYSMSTLFSAMKPVLLTRFVEQHGWSDALAGLAVAMPFVGIAAAALIVTPLVKRFTLRALALMLGGTLVVAELISMEVHSQPGLLLGLQLLAGVCVGVLMGASSRLVATTETPGPLFGAADMVGVLLMSTMIATVGAAVGQFGLSGGYGVAMAIAVLFTLLMLPFQETGRADSAAGDQDPLSITREALAVVAMAVVFVTSSGFGFTYMFTVAQGLGMNYAEAGRGIGILLLISASACLAGGWVSARVGPRRPLAIAFIICALGWYGAIHATSATMFYTCLVPAVFALQFNFPILLDLAGSLDKAGRWGAIAAPLQTSGFAWAAILAGLIVGRYGVTAIPLATAVGMVICLFLLLLSRPARRF
ncbi:MAG: MFS transporter [Pseudomonadota bacterium]